MSKERFGLTEPEVAALTSYLGHTESIAEIKAWYDGYAQQALAQIEGRSYDGASPLLDTAAPRLRWGVAFGGNRVAVACSESVG